jgi:hypothetical protein
VLSLIQLYVLVSGTIPPSRLNIDIFSGISSFLACIGLCPLLFLEDNRSIRPSDLAVVYISVSLAGDFAEVGTAPYKRWTSVGILPAMGNIFLKLVLLVVESRGKEMILQGPQGQWPPEELAGVFGRALFWWINPILAKGHRNILTVNNLPLLDHTLSSNIRRQLALKAWDQRGNVMVSCIS